MNTLDYALGYLKKGWKIVPLYSIASDGRCLCGKNNCTSQGKHPDYRLAPQGVKNASNNETVVRDWCRGNINIGIATGTESDLIVLDIDPDHGGEESLKKYPVPDTLEVQTGSGGRHFYFRAEDKNIGNSAGKLGPGLDVRGSGGYIVAPPSMHSTGNRYIWKNDPDKTAIAKCPEFILSPAQPREQKICPDKIITGSRNDSLASLAGSMHRKGFSKEAILAALLEENRSKCSPPLDESEVINIARSICKYDQDGQVSDNCIDLPDDHLDTLAEHFESYRRQRNILYRYNSFDGWSLYKSGRYHRIEDIKELEIDVRRFLSKCRVKCYSEKAQGGYKRLSKKNHNCVKDIIGFLSGHSNVYLKPEMKAPFSLDGSLDPRRAIAVGDKIVDLRSFPHKVLSVNENFYTHNYLDYEYQPDSISDKWGNFIVDITGGDIEKMTLLQQWCGYLLMPSLKYQKFFLGVGQGSNGKFVFFDTISAAIGKANVSNVPLARFADKHALFSTYGKMVNMTNESCKELNINAETVIKEFTGGDKMQFEQKYKDPFFAYPTAKLMIATNELPVIKDISDGIWRRMIHFPFDVQIPEHKQIKDLAEQLQHADELAGVLNWMLEGKRMLEDKGRFIEAESCRTSLEEYRTSMNPTGVFISENICTDDEGSIECNLLYRSYVNWCEENGYHAKNASNFGKEIFRLFPGVKKSRPWSNGRKIYIYLGIRPSEGCELSELQGVY